MTCMLLIRVIESFIEKDVFKIISVWSLIQSFCDKTGVRQVHLFKDEGSKFLWKSE